MLKQRIITALLLIPFVLGGIIFLSPQHFAWVLVPIFMIAANEWGRFIDKSCIVTRWSFTLTVGLLLVALNCIVPTKSVWELGSINPIFEAIVTIGAIWWLINIVLVAGFPKSDKFWKNSPMLKSIFGQLTLVPCFTSLVTLKSLSLQSASSPYLGGVMVLLVMLVVWAADTGAYFSGRRFGKHKLMPKVSPGKTLEGLIGGLIMTMLVVAGVMYYSPTQELSLVIAVTLFTALASALGDLSESMFKRVAKIKDSGNILPGHGGVLDRIDSLTAAFPVFTLIYIAFWM